MYPDRRWFMMMGFISGGFGSFISISYKMFLTFILRINIKQLLPGIVFTNFIRNISNTVSTISIFHALQ